MSTNTRTPDADQTMTFPMQHVLVLVITRLFINMTRRFYYPFLPEISRILAVPLSSVQGAAASQSGIGLVTPLFGGLADQFGRKRIMLAAVAMMSLASFVGMLMPNEFAIFYAVMVVWGFAKWVFDPAMQAYIADRVPYIRRGFAIGLTEWAWAGALLLGAPAAGILLDLSGLQAVYAVLGFLLLNGFFLVWRYIPFDHPSGEHHHQQGIATGWKILWGNPIALAALLFSLTLYAANEMVFIVYGGWMESTFGLELTELGFVTVVIACAEVLGEGVVIGWSDRIGKRRLALIMTFLSSLGYFLLPQLSFSLVAAMLGLFGIFLTIEVAIVSSIPLFTEVLPEARSVMMSSVVAAQGSGRFIGAFLGGVIYANSNFALTGVVACGIGMLAYGLMQFAIQENHASSKTGSI